LESIWEKISKRVNESNWQNCFERFCEIKSLKKSLDETKNLWKMSKKSSSDCEKWNVIEDKEKNYENFESSIFESKDWIERKWEF
jgi:hypothetical protein